MTCCPHCGKAITPARPGPLTPRQQQLRDFIAGAVTDGRPAPTVREMMRGVGASNPSQIANLLDRLEERGHIRRLRFRQRGIELVERAS